MPGVATTHPTQPKPAALEHTVPLQGFHREIGTTRKETTAIAQQGADRQLIATDQQNQKPNDR
jgi:hypothetical protein